MLKLYEKVTCGHRTFLIYENTNHSRKTWQVFEDGESVFGPTSRKKCYEAVNNEVYKTRIGCAATSSDLPF